MTGNREYKSDVFSMLMEDKSNALQVYNAVNGSDYTDPELIETHTLDKGISLSVRNDAAFVLDMNLSIYEHQPAQYDMRLSDAFEHPVENPEIELICKVYNINFGYNDELLDRCPVLKEYMTFVDYVRENHKENDYDNLQDAIERAIDRCMEENILRGFFMEHRSVVKVMQLDYTFDRQILLEREEAQVEGQAKGIIELGQELGLTDAAILERLQKKLDVSPEIAAGYLKQYGKTLV
jgi:hypothetical protein